MKKKKSKPKKKTTKVLTPKVVKEITTVETKKDGYWSRIITVTYVRKLLCPAFFSNKLIGSLVALPLLILIGLIIWRILSHE